MKYYLVPVLLAEQLNLKEYRKGSADGFVVTIGDLAAYGEEKAIANGAKEISEKEALQYVKKIK